MLQRPVPVQWHRPGFYQQLSEEKGDQIIGRHGRLLWSRGCRCKVSECTAHLAERTDKKVNINTDWRNANTSFRYNKTNLDPDNLRLGQVYKSWTISSQTACWGFRLRPVCKKKKKKKICLQQDYWSLQEHRRAPHLLFILCGPSLNTTPCSVSRSSLGVSKGCHFTQHQWVLLNLTHTLIHLQTHTHTLRKPIAVPLQHLQPQKTCAALKIIFFCLEL